MRELRGNLFDYLEEHPDSTPEELAECFGAPETYAYNYILAMDDAKRQGMLRRSRWIIGCAVMGVILTLLIVAVGDAWMAYDNSRPLKPWKGSEVVAGDGTER